MGAGRATSAQLEAFRQAEANRARRENRPAGTPSRSLWISATLDPRWLATVDHPAPADAAVVRVDPAAAPDGRLASLARAAKRLSRSPVSPASSKKNDLADYTTAADRSDPRRPPPRLHDPRDRQPRGSRAGPPRSPREADRQANAGGADVGPRPLPLPPRRPRAGNAEGRRRRRESARTHRRRHAGGRGRCGHLRRRPVHRAGPLGVARAALRPRQPLRGAPRRRGRALDRPAAAGRGRRRRGQGRRGAGQALRGRRVCRPHGIG